MPSKLRYITRRRKNALKSLSGEISASAAKLAAKDPVKYKEYTETNARKRREEREILNHRISGGAHSTAWYRKQSRKKPVIQEAESA